MGFVVDVGLRCLQDWLRAGEFEKCRSLSLRLLEVEPYHADLNLMLVQVSEQLEGPQAARGVARTRMALFREAQLTPPPELPPYLEKRPDYAQHRAELETLLRQGDLCAAFDYFEALTEPLSDTPRLEWGVLQRTLTVSALRHVDRAFERGDLTAAAALAERTLKNNPLAERVAEALLSILEELHGKTAASKRALEIRAFFEGAGHAFPSVLERYLAQGPLSARGG